MSSFAAKQQQEAVPDAHAVAAEAMQLALDCWNAHSVASRKGVDQLPATLMGTLARLPSDLASDRREEHVADWTKHVWSGIFGDKTAWTPSATVMQLWVYHMIGPMNSDFRQLVLDPFWTELREEGDDESMGLATFESLQLVFATALHLLSQYKKECLDEHRRFATALLSACEAECDHALEEFYVHLLASDLPTARIDEVCASLARQPWLKTANGSSPQGNHDIIKVYMEVKHRSLLKHLEERVVDWLQAKAMHAQDEEIKIRYAAANPRAMLVRYWQHNLSQISMFQIDAMRAWLMYFAPRPDEPSVKPPPAIAASSLSTDPPSDEIDVARAALEQLWQDMRAESTAVDEEILPQAYCKVLGTLTFICTKIKQSPVAPAHLKINLSNPAVRSKFGCYPGALALLQYVGYVPRPSDNHLVLAPEKLPAAQPRIESALALIARAQAKHV